MSRRPEEGAPTRTCHPLCRVVERRWGSSEVCQGEPRHQMFEEKESYEVRALGSVGIAGLQTMSDQLLEMVKGVGGGNKGIRSDLEGLEEKYEQLRNQFEGEQGLRAKAQKKLTEVEGTDQQLHQEVEDEDGHREKKRKLDEVEKKGNVRDAYHELCKRLTASSKPSTMRSRRLMIFGPGRTRTKSRSSAWSHWSRLSRTSQVRSLDKSLVHYARDAIDTIDCSRGSSKRRS